VVNSNNGLESLSIPLEPLSAGVHTLTAQYSGDANYPAFKFGNYTVAVGSGRSTSTSLSASSSTLTAGQTVTFSATVTAPGHSIPSGTVTFTSGSLNLGTVPLNSSGQASITTSSMTPGTYSVVASYTGQQSSMPSQSSPVSVVIAKVPDTLALSATPSPAKVGTAVTISAAVQYVSGDTFFPTGTVTIKDGSTTLATLSVSDGAASFTTSSLAVGTHTLSATYSGDANFVSATAAGSVTITP